MKFVEQYPLEMKSNLPYGLDWYSAITSKYITSYAGLNLLFLLQQNGRIKTIQAVPAQHPKGKNPNITTNIRPTLLTILITNLIAYSYLLLHPRVA